MVFKVVAFSKRNDLYKVVSDAGEQMDVRAIQILNVLLQGYKFVNVHLTGKGFGVVTPVGTRYIQINMDTNTQRMVYETLKNMKLAEQQAKQQQEQLRRQQQEQLRQQQQEQLRKQQKQLKEPVEQLKKWRQQQVNQEEQAKKSEAVNKIGKTTKINAKAPSTKIIYKGDTYMSDKILCRKFGADVERFRKLRECGYSIDEALGLKPLRPQSELVSPKKVQKALDSMARQRGEY